MENKKSEIKNWFRKLRRKYNMLQKDMAKLLDYSRLNLVENLKTPLPEEILLKLKHLFNLTEEDVIFLRKYTRDNDATMPKYRRKYYDLTFRHKTLKADLKKARQTIRALKKEIQELKAKQQWIFE